jgi:hypothetical protein
MATSSAVLSWELLSKNNVKSNEKISANKSKTSHEFGNNCAGIIISRKLSIALIKPTFTAAAYDNPFYRFFSLLPSTAAGKNINTSQHTFKQSSESINTFVICIFNVFLTPPPPFENVASKI